ncbi:aspartyl protease family protein [Flavisphingomonas formosensis]|uniref:aspartyl protease family protein n=1 Tax=Flavisphingomonas formosensis TaxID=861534 RepID=UPI0012F77DA5|nr:aspartyl protease family protein [Sphingomonas formosensis]
MRDGAVGAWHGLDLATSRYLTLPARLNGRPFRAMLDSGASRSVVRHDLALDLDLPYVGAVVATTFTQDMTGTLYRLDDLELDAATFHHVDISSYDLSPVEGMAGTSIPVVLGQDVLRAVDLDVEFGKDRARFLSPYTATGGENFTRIGLQGSSRNFPSVPITLEDHIHDHAIVDLGSDVPLTMSRDFAEHFRMLRDRPVSTSMTYGLEGASVSQIMTLREARIGPFRLANVPTCVIEDWEFAEPLALGWPMLAQFDTRLSLGRNLLLLKADEGRYGQAFPKDRSGLGAQRRSDHILIRHVALNSPAGRAGLKEGDSIVAVDGRAVDTSYPAPGLRLGGQTAGTRLTLTLADGRVVPLVLADYF